MKIRIVLTAVLAVLTLTEAAFAQQPVGSFEELDTRLRVSDYVQIVDRNGKKVTGQVESLSEASMSLLKDSSVRKQTLNYSDKDVFSITKINKDSTLDGKLIGGSIGALLMLVATFGGNGSDAYSEGSVAIFAAALSGGLGFGAGAITGAIIDGHHNSKEVVYKSAPSSARLNIKPLVSKQVKGAALSMRF